MKPRAATYTVRVLAGLLLASPFAGAVVFAQTPAVLRTPAGRVAPGTLPVDTRPVDIRDIRGLEPIASPWLWSIWAATAVLLASGAYVAWRWRRRRRIAPVKLSYEIALERLEEARVLMQSDSVRLFSIVVSDIVRLYIEQRFHIMAAHRTTEEFLYDLLDPSDALLATHRTPLAEFLNHCDLAKFGGWTLSRRDMESMYESARTFVLTTGQPLPTAAIYKQAPSSAGKDIYDAVSSA